MALVLSIVGLVGGKQSVQLGGTTNYDTLAVTGLQLGASGTSLTQFLSGSVSCATGASTITAAATSSYQCAATGVQTGDNVFVTLPVTTPVFISLVSARASTTANGIIELTLKNASTTATIAVAGATSSVQYFSTR